MIQLLKKHLLNPIINSAKPDFCKNIVDRARSENWLVQKVHEPFTLKLAVPDGGANDATIRAAFESQQHMEFPAQHLVCIPDAMTFGGLVKLPSGEFLTESDWRMRDFLASNISRSRFHRHKLHLDGDCYYLDILFSANYAHWLSDDLPRLASALPFLPSKTRFIVSDPIQQYKSESLAALGITQDRLVPVKGYYKTRYERLWYVTPTNDMIWNPKMLSQVRDALLRTYANTPESAPDRIFVSRNTVRWKRLMNEDKLLSVIESYGFSIVHPERLSLAQQVKIFSAARAVMGVHGAGLTNLLFCPPGRLLELQDSHYAPRSWYWKWASMLGHEYSTLIGPMTANLVDFLDTEFTIHPDSLKQYLEDSLLVADAKPKKQ